MHEEQCGCNPVRLANVLRSQILEHGPFYELHLDASALLTINRLPHSGARGEETEVCSRIFKCAFLLLFCPSQFEELSEQKDTSTWTQCFPFRLGFGYLESQNSLLTVPPHCRCMDLT